MKRRVVVTGLGLLTSLGQTVDETWQGILAGKSGIRKITHFDASDISCQISGHIESCDIEAYVSGKEARRQDTFIQYGLVAAIQAVRDSGLVVTEENAHRVGVALGSGIGGLPLIEKSYDLLIHSGPRKISPFFIPGAIINMISGQLSILYGMRGPNLAIVTACTTGTHNIGLAARAIQYGDADVMVCGGSEMATTKLGLTGFAAMRALSTRNDAPEKASRPWDKDRDGFILGDGAGALVLEEYEFAKRRGATIYAELAGFGMSADGYHMTSPEPNGLGAALAIENALADAHVSAGTVNYINAHGTSTPAGDEIEIRGIKKSLGAHARHVAVSSTKSMIGHLLGASGAVEAVFSVLAIRDQVAPPTINLDNPDEGCDLNLVPHTAQEMKIEVVLSNSFGFGGTNGTLLFKKISS